LLMHKKTTIIFGPLFAVMLLLLPPGLAACSVPASPVRNEREVKVLSGKTASINELEAYIAQTMDKANVAGLFCAIINDGQMVYQKAFGFKDKRAGTLNDKETITGAASLSKTVFAYLVMILVEEGKLDLDRPLHEYFDKPLLEYPAYADLVGDERYKQVTARMVLSHSTGFPNWRFLESDRRLKFLFSPGQRHSYSGEGIALLQMAVQEITGQDLETLAQAQVFKPLGMTRTSYVWQEAYEANVALPHDEFGRPRKLIKRLKPDAAGSMVTTAGDYARFLVGILNAAGKRKATVDEMLRSQIAITYQQMFGPGAWKATDKNNDIHLAWGLGWGRFDSEHGRAFFHTGHDFGYQNYTVTYLDKRIGLVLLSNSDNFESVAREIAQKAIGDKYSPFDWLGYVPFDPAIKKTPPPEPVAVEISPTILQRYVGRYELPPDMTVHVKFENGKLYLSSDARQWDQAYAESETRFFVQGDDTRFAFVQDSGGQVVRLDIVVQGLALPAQKVK